ncbi:hypothetical protein GCM10010517_75270 [Streptosporangium fragile]|uniref:Uncharacterized protein n=1 Tax=Streptosporangium fragile TaxID=46186 RepID=A0ABN3WA76_9ACTN
MEGRAKHPGDRKKHDRTAGSVAPVKDRRGLTGEHRGHQEDDVVHGVRENTCFQAAGEAHIRDIAPPGIRWYAAGLEKVTEGSTSTARRELP